jgi:hypothetical protein
MSNLENALRELGQKRDRALSEVEKLSQVISGIESLSGIGVSQKSNQPIRKVSAASRHKMALAQRTRWVNLKRESQSESDAKTLSVAPAERTMSAAARKRISLVQKARWAKAKGQATAPKPKRHISVAGKRRIAAAARERWKQFRATRKKAA